MPIRADDMSPGAVRLLTPSQAAAYCGLTVGGLREWVEANRIPGPLPGTRRYDRLAIDRALDRLSGLTSHEPSPLEKWKAERNGNHRAA